MYSLCCYPCYQTSPQTLATTSCVILVFHPKYLATLASKSGVFCESGGEEETELRFGSRSPRTGHRISDSSWPWGHKVGVSLAPGTKRALSFGQRWSLQHHKVISQQWGPGQWGKEAPFGSASRPLTHPIQVCSSSQVLPSILSKQTFLLGQNDWQLLGESHIHMGESHRNDLELLFFALGTASPLSYLC